jgi:hypothetical protein
MKAVLNLLLFCILFFEIVSPFLIGYLNATTTKITYADKTEKNQPETKPKASKPAATISDLELFDESFCDSKSLKFKDGISMGK